MYSLALSSFVRCDVNSDLMNKPNVFHHFVLQSKSCLQLVIVMQDSRLWKDCVLRTSQVLSVRILECLGWVDDQCCVQWNSNENPLEMETLTTFHLWIEWSYDICVISLDHCDSSRYSCVCNSHKKMPFLSHKND